MKILKIPFPVCNPKRTIFIFRRAYKKFKQKRMRIPKRKILGILFILTPAIFRFIKFAKKGGAAENLENIKKTCKSHSFEKLRKIFLQDNGSMLHFKLI